MKHYYPRGFVLLALIAFYIIPSTSFSQCTCTGGVPATAIDQKITISPTKSSTLNFNFQQFDPSIGNLSCVTLHDTLTGTSVTGARNKELDTIGYLFDLSLTNQVKGPGITITNFYDTLHGLDSLAPYGIPGDTITYGPDNFITDPYGLGNTGGNAAYLGLGTVNFSYNITGGMIAKLGSTNYASSISTVIGGTMKLTYYWCPATPLGVAISNFSAYKKDGVISLQWMAANDQSNITYEIQYSKDGESWASAGTLPAGSAPTGTVAQYQYQYHPAATDVGEIYFRILCRNGEGDIAYSAIKVIDLQQADQRPGIQVYPNPVSNWVTVQFDERQTGPFNLELISTTGQIIQRKQIQMGGNSLASMELTSHPAKGIYFLRAAGIGSNRQFLTKVIVD